MSGFFNVHTWISCWNIQLVVVASQRTFDLLMISKTNEGPTKNCTLTWFWTSWNHPGHQGFVDLNLTGWIASTVFLQPLDKLGFTNAFFLPKKSPKLLRSCSWWFVAERMLWNHYEITVMSNFKLLMFLKVRFSISGSQSSFKIRWQVRLFREERTSSQFIGQLGWYIQNSTTSLKPSTNWQLHSMNSEPG